MKINNKDWLYHLSKSLYIDIIRFLIKNRSLLQELIVIFHSHTQTDDTHNNFVLYAPLSSNNLWGYVSMKTAVTLVESILRQGWINQEKS